MRNLDWYDMQWFIALFTFKKNGNMHAKLLRFTQITFDLWNNFVVEANKMHMYNFIFLANTPNLDFIICLMEI